MNGLFSKHKWLRVLYGSLFLVAGIILLIVSIKDPAKISTWLSIVLGIGLCIFGVSIIYSYIFSLEDRYFDVGFVFGAAAITLAIVVFTKPTLLGEFISLIIGTFIVTFGVIEIGEASAMLYFKKKTIYVVLFYIIGVLLLAAGVLCIVYRAEVTRLIYIACSIAFILLGLFELFLGLKALNVFSKGSKRNKKVAHAKTVKAKEVE